MTDPMDMPTRKERACYALRYLVRGGGRKTLLAIGILGGIALIVWLTAFSSSPEPAISPACKLAVQHEQIVVGANNAIDARLNIAPVGQVYDEDMAVLLQVERACPVDLPGIKLVQPS